MLKGTFNLKTYNPSRLTFANEGLVCLAGSGCIVNDGQLAPYRVDGLITLEGTSSGNSAFQLKPWNSQDNQTIQVDAKVRSTASTDYIYVPRNASYRGNVKLLGDMTEFDGWVNVSSNVVYFGTTGHASENTVLSLNNTAECRLDVSNGTTVPFGRVDLNTRSWITVPSANVISIRNFRVEGGTALDFTLGTNPDQGRIDAAALAFLTAGTVDVRVSGGYAAYTNASSHVLLTAPEGALDLARFTLTHESTILPIPSDLALSVETVEGRDRLVLSWNPIVEQVVSIPSAGYATRFNEAATWSNGKVPSENGGHDFYSPSGMATYFPSMGSAWTFPGRSFTKDGGALTFQAARNTVVSNFYVKSGTQMRIWPSGSNLIISPLKFYGASATTPFAFGNRTTLEWRGPISGDTVFEVYIRHFGSDQNDLESCYFRPSGDNSGFTGRWTFKLENTTVSDTYRDKFTGFENFFMGLIVERQANLGGPLAAFTYNALTLEGWQALIARAGAGEAAVVLDEPTRGINAVGTPQFIVDTGKTLSVSSPLTLTGVLKKKGTGLLALGGTTAPRFCQSSQLTAAQVASAGLTETNVLLIAEGGLKPLSKTGVDGLAVRVGPSGSLRLALEPTGDAATYGFFNTAWATPFAAVDASGAADAAAKIAVAFELPAGGIEKKSYTVPVCTVAEAAAASLRGKFACASPAKNYSVKIAEVAGADPGTVTFVATVGPGGLTILFR